MQPNPTKARVLSLKSLFLQINFEISYLAGHVSMPYCGNRFAISALYLSVVSMHVHTHLLQLAHYSLATLQLQVLAVSP